MNDHPIKGTSLEISACTFVCYPRFKIMKRNNHSCIILSYASMELQFIIQNIMEYKQYLYIKEFNNV